jgi:hypothetical protein
MGACQSSDAVQTTAKPEASKGATTDNAKLGESLFRCERISPRAFLPLLLFGRGAVVRRLSCVVM